MAQRRRSLRLVNPHKALKFLKDPKDLKALKALKALKKNSNR